MRVNIETSKLYKFGVPPRSAFELSTGISILNAYLGSLPFTLLPDPCNYVFINADIYIKKKKKHDVPSRSLPTATRSHAERTPRGRR